jgi:hypothetical protein
MHLTHENQPLNDNIQAASLAYRTLATSNCHALKQKMYGNSYNLNILSQQTKTEKKQIKTKMAYAFCRTTSQLLSA